MKKLIALMLALAMCVSLCSCSVIKPYDKPEFVTIGASETAFLIDLTGDAKNQASFESEEMLEKARVATKEVQIPHRWVQTGRWPGDGEWRDSAKLITVDRTVVTREWSADRDNGTSVQDQAIYAESLESIGFSVGMNCSAQIYSEEDAVRFLYEYNTKPLSEVMDTEIRSRVEAEYNEQTGDKSMAYIAEHKAEIMQAVRDRVVEYFYERGITITELGMKDGIQYEDPVIQDAINKKFSSAQELEKQKNENAAAEEKAKSEAEQMRIKADAEAKANKVVAASLSPELVEYRNNEEWNKKWNGSLAEVITSDSVVVSNDTKSSKSKK